MKATADRAQLREAVASVKPVVNCGAIQPAIKNILLTAGKGQLQVTGSNLKVFINATVPAKVTRAGTLALPAKEFEELLKNMGDGDIVISTTTASRESKQYRWNEEKKTTDEVTVTISTVKGLLECNGLKVEMEAFSGDYPPVPGAIKGVSFSIPNPMGAIGKVDWAMAKEDTRMVLKAVCINQRNGKTELVASDGFVLALTTLKVKGKVPRQLILPREAVEIVKKAKPTSITITVTKKAKDHDWCSITMETKKPSPTIYTCLVNGTFPNYMQLMPSGGSALKVDTTELVKAIKMVQVVGDNPGHDPMLMITKGKKLTLSVKSDTSVATTTLPAKGKCKTAVAPRKLLPVLQRIGDTAVMRMQGKSPIAIRENGTTYLVMPMRVAELSD